MNHQIAMAAQNNSLLKASITNESHLDPDNLSKGEVCIIRHVNHKGVKHFEELLKITEKDFLIINHTRDSLMCGGVLTSRNAWNKGENAAFDIKNKPHRIYETGKITDLELLKPNEVYQVMSQKYEHDAERYYVSRFDVRNDKFDSKNFMLKPDKKTWIELNITGEQGYFKVYADSKDLAKKLTSEEIANSQFLVIAELLPNGFSGTDEEIKRITTLIEGQVNRVDNHWRVTKKAQVEVK
jgi:hypothetical protein